MYSKETKLVNQTGMHARPASDFVAAAKAFSAKVFLKNLDKEGSEPVNAKSIVRILALGLSRGTRIEISAEGEDEQAAVEKLTALVDEGFGEV